MRGFVKLTMVAGLALVLASSAQAQRQRPGGFGGGLGVAGLIQNEGVQKELNITDDQKTKLREALGKVREDHKDDLAKLRDRDTAREERQKLMKTLNDDMNKALSSTLDEKQMKRLHQIGLQTQGARAFLNPEVQSKLKLTDEQKGKIKDINEEAGKQMREIFQGGFNEEAQKKMAELRKGTLEKTTGVLTADQKKTWQDMTGKPFEVKFERPRRNRTN